MLYVVSKKVNKYKQNGTCMSLNEDLIAVLEYCKYRLYISNTLSVKLFEMYDTE